MSEDESRIREKLFLRSFALSQEIPRAHQRQGAVEVQCFAEVNKIASAYVMAARDPTVADPPVTGDITYALR
jgi:hypothetical protein